VCFGFLCHALYFFCFSNVRFGTESLMTYRHFFPLQLYACACVHACLAAATAFAHHGHDQPCSGVVWPCRDFDALTELCVFWCTRAIPLRAACLVVRVTFVPLFAAAVRCPLSAVRDGSWLPAVPDALVVEDR
jgi:hypothetical protein